MLTSRRHINIRGKSADLPSINDKDWQDINFGMENHVDFIALSFVRNASAIEELQRGGIIKAGDRVIVLSDILVGGKFIETEQVRTI